MELKKGLSKDSLSDNFELFLHERSELKLDIPCKVCYYSTDIYTRPCCNLAVCSSCMSSYITEKIKNSELKIKCPNSNCNKLLSKDEIALEIDENLLKKFNQYLVDFNNEINIKTCPQCCHIMKLDIKLFKRKKTKKHPTKVKCEECSFDWCFECHAPWHENISCKQYKKSDKSFKQWTKEYTDKSDQINARRCPECKTFIQRSDGCQHMICSKCSVSFCYDCGDKYRSIKYLGDHKSKYSIIGCKKLLFADKPILRKLVRGGLFSLGYIVAPPIVGLLALAALGLALGVSIVILPFYGSYRFVKFILVSYLRKN